MSDPVLYEKKGHKAYITFNRPERMNAMNPEAWDLLAEYYKKAGDDEDVYVILLTGKGDKAFNSGADLETYIPQLTSGNYTVERLDDCMLKHSDMWTPIVAAVNGHCLAGGTELLQATDIRVASTNATFGLPETSLGLTPAGGSLVRLARQIPYCRAMEILLTGDRVTAEEAHNMGLVNKVVEQDDLMDVAEGYADSICENGPLAVQHTKRAVVRLLSLPMEQAFHEEPLHAQEVLSSEDAQEGPLAFAEKRDPNYKGE